MAWPEVARTVFAADQAVKLANVQALEARDEHLAEHPISGYFLEATRTNVAFGTMATLVIWTPGWATGQLCTLNANIEGYVTAGTGVWRLVDSTDSVTGADSADITVGTYASTTASVTHTADNFRAEHAITVEGKCSGGGTIYLRSLGIEFWWSMP